MSRPAGTANSFGRPYHVDLHSIARCRLSLDVRYKHQTRYRQPDRWLSFITDRLECCCAGHLRHNLPLAADIITVHR